MLAIKIAIKCCIKKKNTPLFTSFSYSSARISVCPQFLSRGETYLQWLCPQPLRKHVHLAQMYLGQRGYVGLNLAMWGYLCSLLFHHASGSSSTEMQPVALYEVTSSWMMSDKGFVLLSSVLKNLQIPLPWQIWRRGLWWPWLRSWGWTGRLGFTALTLMSIWQNRHFGNISNNK